MEAGQSDAASRGVRAAVARGAERVLLVPGDCPSLDADEVTAVLRAFPSAGVVIVPDRHGTGTNALLLDPPEYLLTAKVFDLLLAVPKYGRVKVNRILTHCRISPSKTIGGLSERQRNELVSFLRR